MNQHAAEICLAVLVWRICQGVAAPAITGAIRQLPEERSSGATALVFAGENWKGLSMIN